MAMNYLASLLRNILLVAVILIAVIFSVIHNETSSFIVTSEKIPSDVTTGIVLGASVTSTGTLSLILQDRADTAIDLYKKGVIKRILISGDNRTPTHNEVTPTHDYIVKAGVPENVIYLDHAGFDTYSSMYRARMIFGLHKAVIITQTFHLPRALFIAQRLGIEAYGVSSDNKHSYFLKNAFREIFADVKAIIDVSISRKPKSIGDTIPIS